MKEQLLKQIHEIGEEYYSVDHSTCGVSFYEYLARRLVEVGYVKLAENQELPETPLPYKAGNFSIVRHNAYEDGQATMVNSGWRKIELIK